jgi:uncharacterized protein YuzE
MIQPVYRYDEENDICYISFAPGERGTGVELSDQILVRMNKPQRRAIGLTLFDYSVLTQATELGPRSFPLTGLSQISADLRDLVLEILSRPPVSDILQLSAYTPSLSETTPIVSIGIILAQLSPMAREAVA